MSMNNCPPKHFCNCPVEKCPCHPFNHDKGCDPCIQDNLKKGKMPACFFRAVHDDASQVRDFSIAGFVDYFLEHQSEYKAKYKK